MLERIDWNIEHVGEVDRAARRHRAPTRSRSASPTSRSVSSRTSARGTIPTSSGSTRSSPRCSSGNAVCYKPSEHATLTGLRLVDLMHRSGVPVDVVHAIVGRGRDRRGARRGRRRHGVLHRFVRDRPARGRGRSPIGWSACSSSSAARTPRTCATTSTSRRPRSRSPRARSTTAGSRAARPSASTCTRRSGTRSSPRWSTWSPPTASAIPSDDATDVGPLARAEQLDVLEAQLADAVAARRARCCAAATASTGPATGSRRRSSSTFPTTPRSCATRASVRSSASARVARRRRSRRRGWTTPSSVSARRCSRAIATARERVLAPARRRQRLLEHRRPFVRAAAVVGPPPLRPRHVDVGVRRPHVRAREGLAPELRGCNDRHRLVRAGDRHARVVLRVDDRDRLVARGCTSACCRA